jgi:hypothetical protein
MRKTWSFLAIGALLLMILSVDPVNGASASIDIEEDEFFISVNPEDDYAGYLEIHGTIEGDLQRLDQLTVTLSANITEEYDGEPTGRYWACSAEFDDEAVTPEETRLTYNQDTADFTIYIDPELADPAQGDVAVETGMSPLTEGKLELVLAYTGSSSGDDIEWATITPEYYHLVEVSTPTTPLEVKAGNKLNYTLRVVNEGNDYESVTIEIPMLEEMENDGWTTSLNITHVYDMEPGQQMKAGLLLEAPNEITIDRDLDLVIRVFTDMFDAETGDPLSEDELTLTFNLKRSKVNEPVVDDDDTTDDDTVDDDELPANPESSPYAIIGVTAVMAILAIVVIILLFIKRGGGDDGDEEEDMHAAMVRI